MTYEGYEVWTKFPLNSGPKLNIVSDVNDFGYDFTKMQRKVIGDKKRSLDFSFQCDDLSERKWAIDFFRAAIGRYTPFWIPTFRNDFTVTRENIGANIYIVNSEHYSLPDIAGSHIAIIKSDSSLITTRVLSCSYVSSTEELLSVQTLSETLPIGTPISMLKLVRFSSDYFEITSTEADVSKFSMSFEELIREVP